MHFNLQASKQEKEDKISWSKWKEEIRDCDFLSTCS